MGWLWRQLNRSICGEPRRWLTRDASVDPSDFPEYDFPVHCPACAYLLRGLPDGRCPECGRQFQRGRLLVEQYVTQAGRQVLRKHRGFRVALQLCVASYGLVIILSLLVDLGVPLPVQTGWPLWTIAVPYAGILLLPHALAIYYSVRIGGEASRKRKRVSDAVPPEYHTATTPLTWRQLLPTWIHPLLNRPLMGTSVLPPDARVDPSAFAEDEFPLYCPKCDYQLRGLTDDRCPECGETFDRGRLLVQQYALWRVRRQRAYQKGLIALIALSAIVLLLHFGGDYVLGRKIAAWAAEPPMIYGNAGKLAKLISFRAMFSKAMSIAEIVTVAVALGLMATVAIRYRAMAAKRRQVVEAIGRTASAR